MSDKPYTVKAYSIRNEYIERIEQLKKEKKVKYTVTVNTALKEYFERLDQAEALQEEKLGQIRGLLGQAPTSASVQQLVELATENEEGRKLSELMWPWSSFAFGLSARPVDVDEDYCKTNDLPFYKPVTPEQACGVHLYISPDGLGYVNVSPLAPVQDGDAAFELPVTTTVDDLYSPEFLQFLHSADKRYELYGVSLEEFAREHFERDFFVNEASSWIEADLEGMSEEEARATIERECHEMERCVVYGIDDLVESIFED